METGDLSRRRGVASQADAAPPDDELWRTVTPRLVAWSMGKHKLSPWTAEEMVQEAVAQLLRSNEPIPTSPKELMWALGSKINGLMRNLRRAKALNAVETTDDGHSPEGKDGRQDPEAAALTADVAKKATDLLLDRLKDDELAFLLVLQITEGVDEPKEQATALGRPIQDIYNARRRLRSHQAAVASTLGVSS